MLNKKYYAGIGSRDIPSHIEKLMSDIASLLEIKGYILRSGGARGSDLAFEKGVNNKNNKEIFYTDYYTKLGVEYKYEKSDLNFADSMVKKYHPSKGKINNKHAYKLQARNTFQYFGIGDTQNSSFIICYTKDGSEGKTTFETGGTGQCLRIAYDYNTKIYNLKNYVGVSAKEMVDFIIKETVDMKDD